MSALPVLGALTFDDLAEYTGSHLGHLETSNE